MKTISLRDMLRQVKRDLIGKDSYRGVTLTYTWLANQFGHFSLGFIPTYFIYFFLKPHYNLSSASVYAALIISTGWLLFETYNFLGPLLLERKQGANNAVARNTRAEYSFTPPWANIAFDTITDISFFWTGAFSSSLLLYYSDIKLIILLLLVCLLAYPSYYWYLTKMYIQQAIYPYQFRLSQWDKSISYQNKIRICQFLENPNRGNHLLVFGAKHSGPDSLCIGIGTERAIKHQSCSYITAMKLFGLLNEDYESGDDNHTLWNWRSSSVLIIDDIHPANPGEDEIITPHQFLRFITNSEHCNENLKAIKEKDVVWVMGAPGTEKTLSNWQGLFETIGVQKEKITSINLMEVD